MDDILKRSRHFHFVGIGGIGMSALCRLLLRQGFQVSGSDLHSSRLIQDLEKEGARIHLGHHADNLGEAQVVIYSSAVRDDNPELVRARRMGLPVFRRAQMLAILMQGKFVIAVTGAHGKTTTSSLVATILEKAGLKPTVAVGGILNQVEDNALLGEGVYFVAEADESDGTFLYYHPRIAVVTNIDYEHLDYYGDFQSVLSAYRDFVLGIKSEGSLYWCADDPYLAGICKDVSVRAFSFGFSPLADIRAAGIIFDGFSTCFDCIYRGEDLGRFWVRLCGRHNVSNSLAVIGVGMELGIRLADIKKALEEYGGARRRFQVRYRSSGFTLIEDYAHHPTEIISTLEAAKNFRPGRLIAVFQPHRYSRTKSLKDKFIHAFDACDYLVLTDVYPAGETPIPGVDTRLIYDDIKRKGSPEVVMLPKQSIREHLLGFMKEGDLVMVMGAGDITKVADELAEDLQRQGIPA